MPTMPNLFADAEPPAQGERFDTVLRSERVTIERIVSSDRPEPAIYDQAGDEWVVLLRGTAVLEIDGVPHALAEGDHVHLPAHRPHRVLRTSAGALWLAVHLA
jgi:cupin 2 domain-containing protein